MSKSYSPFKNIKRNEFYIKMEHFASSVLLMLFGGGMFFCRSDEIAFDEI